MQENNTSWDPNPNVDNPKRPTLFLILVICWIILVLKVPAEVLDRVLLFVFGVGIVLILGSYQQRRNHYPHPFLDVLSETLHCYENDEYDQYDNYDGDDNNIVVDDGSETQPPARTPPTVIVDDCDGKSSQSGISMLASLAMSTTTTWTR